MQVRTKVTFVFLRDFSGVHLQQLSHIAMFILYVWRDRKIFELYIFTDIQIV